MLGGTNSPENLVSLTIEEHAEAHRLLYEEHGNIKDKVAWLALSGRITSEEARIMVAREASIGNTFGRANKGKKNPKVSEHMMGNQRGRGNKGQIPWSKGKRGEGVSTHGMRWVTNGTEEQIIEQNDIIPEGWIIGRLERRWITDGYKNKKIKEGQSIPLGWKIGRTMPDNYSHSEASNVKRSLALKGKPKPPRSAEHAEALSAALKGRISITDGVSTKMVPPDTLIPVGWKRGRT